MDFMSSAIDKMELYVVSGNDGFFIITANISLSEVVLFSFGEKCDESTFIPRLLI